VSSDILHVLPTSASDLPPGVKIIFILGGPGSGKGTQCERIVAKYGYKHLSAGDLLRHEVKSGSELGLQCEAVMKEGKLVSQEVTIGLLRAAMVASSKTEFLIDGFPRALDHAKTFERQIKPCELVLFFDCPEEVMTERLLSRGKTSGRTDDNAETIRKRFKTFVESSLPVVGHYEAQGKAHKISAIQPPDEVFLEVQKVLDTMSLCLDVACRKILR
jgi:adenylate kinase/UMP-CMP kinase